MHFHNLFSLIFLVVLQCDKTHLAVGGSDGMVSILELSDDFTHMRCIYKLEDHYFSGEPVTSVRICGAEILTSVKDQPNLSIVNWKRSECLPLTNDSLRLIGRMGKPLSRSYHSYHLTYK